jgi:hypothetical protein
VGNPKISFGTNENNFNTCLTEWVPEYGGAIMKIPGGKHSQGKMDHAGFLDRPFFVENKFTVFEPDKPPERVLIDQSAWTQGQLLCLEAFHVAKQREPSTCVVGGFVAVYIGGKPTQNLVFYVPSHRILDRNFCITQHQVESAIKYRHLGPWFDLSRSWILENAMNPVATLPELMRMVR